MPVAFSLMIGTTIFSPYWNSTSSPLTLEFAGITVMVPFPIDGAYLPSPLNLTVTLYILGTYPSETNHVTLP